MNAQTIADIKYARSKLANHLHDFSISGSSLRESFMAYVQLTETLEREVPPPPPSALTVIMKGVPMSVETENFIKKNQKIFAIKSLRSDYPGMGLIMAKNIIEELERV